jgi:hypothetical protein
VTGFQLWQSDARHPRRLYIWNRAHLNAHYMKQLIAPQPMANGWQGNRNRSDRSGPGGLTGHKFLLRQVAKHETPRAGSVLASVLVKY